MRALSDLGNSVYLTGRLDTDSAEATREVLREAVEHGHGDLALDLAGIDLVDAAGLGVLVSAHRLALRRGRRLLLQRAPALLSRVLAATGLDRVLNVVREGTEPTGPRIALPRPRGAVLTG